jgi:predicted membrane-bound spermidine synthase
VALTEGTGTGEVLLIDRCANAACLHNLIRSPQNHAASADVTVRPESMDNAAARSASSTAAPLRSIVEGGHVTPWFWIGLGLAFATAATLMLEIVLTRIFSVILWYHYGFLTISLALLGLGLAGVFVYVYPERFARDRAAGAAAISALVFAAAAILAILAFHWIVSIPGHWPLGVGYRTLIFLLVLVPFFFAGLCVAIPISRFTERVGVLYAFDLIGAAVGAVCVIPLLGWVGGHPSVIACASVACLSAACFARAAGSTLVGRTAIVGVALCAAGLPIALTTDFFEIRISKLLSNTNEQRVLAERWNSFSRVTVSERLDRDFGWHFGAGAPKVSSKGYWPIMIDGGALTPMLAFDGEIDDLRYLRFDITAFGHRIRPPESALVIGAGGGRDILTAKLFGAETVHAVEVNPLVIGFVRDTFRAQSGSPYDLPGVSWTAEDGRAFAARSRRKFDLVQVSAVDTTAAIAAGALSLVENSLYTVEAFQDFHDRLTDNGMVSVTRNWTHDAQLMALRTADIVRAAWLSRGHERPERHVVIVSPRDPKARWGTLLASARPFGDEELRRIRILATELGFELLYDPGREAAPEFAALFSDDRSQFLRDFPYDVAATTDDHPFFFFFTKPFQVTPKSQRQHLHWGSRTTPTILLDAFILVTILVAVLAFGLPMVLGRMRLGDARSSPLGLVYFAGIGLGFIMVELSLIQRYTLLLGVPVYALSGILGTILVFSGLGSLTTHRFDEEHLPRSVVMVLALLLAGIAAHALFMPPVIRGAMSLELTGRLLTTVASVAPLGYLMGMPLPLGMRLMERRAPAGLAWAWGVNGSLSVLGTVLAMTTSVFMGITTTLLAAAAAYLIGAAWLLTFEHKRDASR